MSRKSRPPHILPRASGDDAPRAALTDEPRASPDLEPAAANQLESNAIPSDQTADVQNPSEAPANDQNHASQLIPVSELPQEALLFLARGAPPRAVWQWLSEPSRVELLHSLTRGFQRTANALRQPVIRARLAEHLRHHAADFTVLLRLWSESAQPTVHEVRAFPEDQAFAEHLPALLRRHGPEAVLLSLLLDERHTALEAWQNLQAEAGATAEETAQPEAQPPQGTSFAASATRDITTDAAIEENKRSEELHRVRLEAHEARVQATRLRDELNSLRLRAQKESQAATLRLQQQEKRGAVAQAQLQVQLQEAQKTLDRTARRLKQNESLVEELTTENKRIRRRLRQSQQLQEELRKQLANATVGLREAEETGRQAQATPQAEAVLQAEAAPQEKPKAIRASPVGTSKAPHTVLVSLSPAVAAALPQDQPFSWTADGTAFSYHGP
jgi:hypothetical protein